MGGVLFSLCHSFCHPQATEVTAGLPQGPASREARTSLGLLPFHRQGAVDRR